MMPRDLLAELPQAAPTVTPEAAPASVAQPMEQQAPSQQPRDLLAPDTGIAPTPQPEAPSGISDLLTEDRTIFNAIKSGIGGAGTGILQGLSDMGYGLADLGDKGINALTQKLFGKDVIHAPHGNMYFGPAEHLKGTIPAKVGELGGNILGTLLGGGALKGLGAAGTLLPKVLAYGGTAAATQPGGLMERGIAGALGGAGGATEHLMSTIPYMFMKKLGQKIETLEKLHKGIGTDLYDEAFKGTEKIAPKISDETASSLEDVVKTWPTAANPAVKAMRVFAKQNNLKALHTLRSDFRKLVYRMKDVAIGKGSTGEDISKSDALNDAIENISKDLRSNMKAVGPETYNKYLIAQKHWREKVIPFRESGAIRELLGEKRKISPRLYKDLTERSLGLNNMGRVRAMLKTNLGSMQLARVMHHKVLGLPLPAYLALGGGFGLYHLKNLVEHKTVGEH